MAVKMSDPRCDQDRPRRAHARKAEGGVGGGYAEAVPGGAMKLKR